MERTDSANRCQQGAVSQAGDQLTESCVDLLTSRFLGASTAWIPARDPKNPGLEQVSHHAYANDSRAAAPHQARFC